jgi:concanavalin A-like lectin/glucanase superfamily protein
MDRGEWSLIVVIVAAIVIAVAVHFPRSGADEDSAKAKASSWVGASSLLGRRATGEDESEAPGVGRRSADVKAPHLTGGDPANGSTKRNTGFSAGNTSESARTAQILPLVGSRHDDVFRAVPESGRKSTDGLSPWNLQDTDPNSGSLAVNRSNSLAAQPGTATSSSQVPSEQQGNAGAPSRASDQNAAPDAMLSLPLHGTTEPEDPGQPQPVAEQNIKPANDGNGVQFPVDSVLEYPDASNFINPQAGSLSLDVKPSWGTPSWDDSNVNNSFVQVKTPDMWQGQIMLFRNGPYLRFVWFDTNQQENGVGVDIHNWAPGEDHSVTATWGDAVMSVYVDGKLAGQQTYSGELALSEGLPMFLGSNPGSHVPGADATLQNFKVYNRPLTPNEVAAQFANRNG